MENNYPPATVVREYPAPRQSGSRSALLLSVLIVLLALWYAPTFVGRIQYARTQAEVQALKESVPELELAAFNEASGRLSRIVGPSVVHIDTRRAGQPTSPFGGRSRGYQSLGEASGVIVDAEGYIVTNSHVIAGADQIEVKIAGRPQPYRARLIGQDESEDLAVLKIAADDLVVAQWGESSKLEVGQFVWAIGNPFGLDGTVTFGIISAKERRGVGSGGAAQDFLQTDAAINPGNSGGALVDLTGKLIGINTAIIGPTNQGIGFAIPVAKVKDVYERLRKNGSRPRGYLGVSLQAVTPEVAQYLRLGDVRGALVAGVQSDSPADKAGLEPLDVIVEWNGEKLQDALELTRLAGQAEIGSTARLTIIREGQRRVVEITVAERSE